VRCVEFGWEAGVQRTEALESGEGRRCGGEGLEVVRLAGWDTDGTEVRDLPNLTGEEVVERRQGHWHDGRTGNRATPEAVTLCRKAVVGLRPVVHGMTGVPVRHLPICIGSGGTRTLVQHDRPGGDDGRR